MSDPQKMYFLPHMSLTGAIYWRRNLGIRSGNSPACPGRRGRATSKFRKQKSAKPILVVLKVTDALRFLHRAISRRFMSADSWRCQEYSRFPHTQNPLSLRLWASD